MARVAATRNTARSNRTEEVENEETIEETTDEQLSPTIIPLVEEIELPEVIETEPRNEADESLDGTPKGIIVTDKNEVEKHVKNGAFVDDVYFKFRPMGSKRYTYVLMGAKGGPVSTFVPIQG